MLTRFCKASKEEVKAPPSLHCVNLLKQARPSDFGLGVLFYQIFHHGFLGALALLMASIIESAAARRASQISRSAACCTENAARRPTVKP